MYPIMKKLTPPDLPRYKDVAIGQTRIGHTRLTHSHLLNKTDASLCFKGGEPLIILHVLISLLLYEEHRKEHFYKFYEQQIPYHFFSSLQVMSSSYLLKTWFLKIYLYSQVPLSCRAVTISFLKLIFK